MKRHKGILIVFAVTLLAFLIVFSVFMKSEVMQSSAVDGIFGDNTETISVDIADTETIEETEYFQEPDTEKVELSYIELYGLEEVDKPEKRTEEQVLQKLAELSEKHELVRQVYENANAYSKGMLEHLANNPEMAAFVLGSLEADGSVTGGFTEEELEQDFPLLLQYDPRWGYFEYGGKEMGLSGCGPTCLAMTVLALTDVDNVTPDKIAAYSLDNKYYVQDVGTAWKLLDEFPTLYGLTVEHPTLKEESIKAELDKGKVLICSVRKGVFTAEGHFVVIYGYDETGFKVNDPKCVARSKHTWDYSEFGNQLKRIWAVGTEKEDTLWQENAQEMVENTEISL